MGCRKLSYYQQEEGLEKSTVHFLRAPGKRRVHPKICSNYYPFGLQISSLSWHREDAVANNYLYNGFELQKDLNLGLYDYLTRQYDPALGRFINVDPAADLMRRFTPYAYAFNNPIRFIDPDGMMPTDVVNRKPTDQELDNAGAGDVIGEGNEAALLLEEVVVTASESTGETQPSGNRLESEMGSGPDEPGVTAENPGPPINIDGIGPQVGKLGGGFWKSIAEGLFRVGKVLGLVSDGEAVTEDPDSDTQMNSPTNETYSTATKKIFLKRTRTFTVKGRVDIDSTFQIGDSTFVETTPIRGTGGKVYPRSTRNEK